MMLQIAEKLVLAGYFRQSLTPLKKIWDNVQLFCLQAASYFKSIHH